MARAKKGRNPACRGLPPMMQKAPSPSAPVFAAHRAPPSGGICWVLRMCGAVGGMEGGCVRREAIARRHRSRPMSSRSSEVGYLPRATWPLLITLHLRPPAMRARQDAWGEASVHDVGGGRRGDVVAAVGSGHASLRESADRLRGKWARRLHDWRTGGARGQPILARAPSRTFGRVAWQGDGDVGVGRLHRSAHVVCEGVTPLPAVGDER
jgi:hypothetical protein